MIKVQQRPPDPEPLAGTYHGRRLRRRAEPVPVPMAEAEPVLDMDDLDTPAYLRQGRLLN